MRASLITIAPTARPPNDLVYRSDGTLFFTDPPFGLPNTYDDPAKELPFSGVFRLSPAGDLKLVSTDLKGPNGIALSPDEKFLYVSNWDEQRRMVMRYDVGGDGTLSNGTVFADLTLEPGDEALDGLKVDRVGNVFVSGPGWRVGVCPIRWETRASEAGGIAGKLGVG